MRRVLRWKAENYWQVWLIDAAGCGLVLFIILALIVNPLAGLTVGVVALVARGAVQSYRLDRRRDSNTISEWTSAGH